MRKLWVLVPLPLPPKYGYVIVSCPTHKLGTVGTVGIAEYLGKGLFQIVASY